jgi:hypothetical protein
LGERGDLARAPMTAIQAQDEKTDHVIFVRVPNSLDTEFFFFFAGSFSESWQGCLGEQLTV